MKEGKCPLCGSPLSVPSSKPFVRLTCGKCHAGLHVAQNGGLVIGDPVDLEEQYRDLQRNARELARRFPVKPLLFGLAGLTVVVWAAYTLFGPAESLQPVAERAAKALADGDPASLTALAAYGTEGDLQRWYDEARPRLVRLREQWGGKTEAVRVQVAKEDRDGGKGTVGLAVEPVSGGARDVSLADPSNATAGALITFEEATDWSLTRWGRWKLDGRATFAHVAPPPPAPVEAPEPTSKKKKGGLDRRQGAKLTKGR